MSMIRRKSGKLPLSNSALSATVAKDFNVLTLNNKSKETNLPTIPDRSPVQSPRKLKTTLPQLPRRPDFHPPTFGELQPNNTEPIEEEGAAETKREDMRRKCLNEIYQTEKDYIDDLRTLINVFIFPLRMTEVLDEKTLYSIFSNVEVLIGCNTEMLKGLGEKMSNATSGVEITIGSVFSMLADYFKMYKVYCANQQNSIQTVDTLLKKNIQFKKNLDICHRDPSCKGLFLQSFLIKPIQRVCKYPLLLRELIRYTPESHSDYEALQAAFKKINEVVADINEAQRQAEGLNRILDLQNMIDGVDSLVAAGRYYVKEGELTYHKKAKSKTGEKRHVFFFTDLILLTVKKGEKKFEHKLSVPLDSCTLIVLANSNQLKNAFELTQKQLTKKCILSGETAEESNQWVKEIRALIKGYQKRKLWELEDQKKKGNAPSAELLNLSNL